MALLAVALVLAGCASVAAAPQKPGERATKLAGEQVARVLHGKPLDMFAPTGLLWVPQQMTMDGGVGGAGLLQVNPHDKATDGSVRDVAAGELGDVMWLAFDVVAQIQPADAAAKATSIVRASELVVGGKVVSGAFVTPHAPCACAPPLDLVVATEPGPLAALATDPAKLATLLADDPAVMVIGPDRERAIGPKAAAERLATLAKQTWTLRGKPHEVDTATWGVVDAQLDQGPIAAGEKHPLRVGLQLYAVRARTQWRVVLVRYFPLD